MKKALFIVGLLLLAGLVAWRTYRNLTRPAGPAGRESRQAAVAVVVEPVGRAAVRDVRRFTGTVVPNAQFHVAPKVAGRLERLMVNVGDAVTNGALIASLDSQEYSQQVEQARAELDVVRAAVADVRSALDIAARDLERAVELRRQQVASQAELDQAEALHRAAEARYAVALAQVQQREAALRASETRLSYTRIHAAWENGQGARVVGERFVDEGAMLRANDPIVSVLDVETVIVLVFVIERDYPHVRVGQPAVITADAHPGRTFTGQVLRMAPLLREASRQARVEIAVPNAARLLAPGMFVRADLVFAERDAATVVPVESLARRNGSAGVFLADPVTRTARYVPVTIGIVDGARAEVLEPPLEGLVVTLGQHLLEDGGAIVMPGAAGEPGGGQPRRADGERP